MPSKSKSKSAKRKSKALKQAKATTRTVKSKGLKKLKTGVVKRAPSKKPQPSAKKGASKKSLKLSKKSIKISKLAPSKPKTTTAGKTPAPPLKPISQPQQPVAAPPASPQQPRPLQQQPPQQSHPPAPQPTPPAPQPTPPQKPDEAAQAPAHPHGYYGQQYGGQTPTYDQQQFMFAEQMAYPYGQQANFQEVAAGGNFPYPGYMPSGGMDTGAFSYTQTDPYGAMGGIPSAVPMMPNIPAQVDPYANICNMFNPNYGAVPMTATGLEDPSAGFGPPETYQGSVSEMAGEVQAAGLDQVQPPQ